MKKKYICISDVTELINTEITNLRAAQNDKNLTEYGKGVLESLEGILNSLETIEVDLDKEIENKINNNLCELDGYMEYLLKGDSEGVYPLPEEVNNELVKFAKHFFELGLRTKGETSGQKKKYCFDYIKEDVMKWAPGVRKNATKQMLYTRVQYPFMAPEQLIDYYGEVISDYGEWQKQKEEYIEELYKQLKMEKNMKRILTVKELITMLLEYNLDAQFYVNTNGIPTGISTSNVCYGGGGEGETKKDCKEVILDVQDEEQS